MRKRGYILNLVKMSTNPTKSRNLILKIIYHYYTAIQQGIKRDFKSRFWLSRMIGIQYRKDSDVSHSHTFYQWILNNSNLKTWGE